MTAELHNDHSVFDEIASLLPAEQREHFYRRMAHLEHLGPDDEILQLAEALGFLVLLTRQTPSEMATERLKLESLFQNTLDTLKATNHTALAYQADIDQHLKDLPADIAGALNPKRLAVQLSETLRQHFQQTGIPTVSDSLAQHAEVICQISQQLSTTVATFVDPERGTVTQLRRALDTMQANLDNAANHIRSLSHALVKDLHRALAVLCFGSLIVGFVLGLRLCRAVLAQTAN
jgi:hypothetical protein